MRANKLTLFVSGAFAVALALGSVAWACTAHLGSVWFCPTNLPGCAPATPQAFTGSQSVYSEATQAQANTTYTLKYVLGNDVVGKKCHTGTTLGTFTTNAFGDWVDQGPVTLPSATNTYTQCARYPATGNPTSTTNHALFTIV